MHETTIKSTVIRGTIVIFIVTVLSKIAAFLSTAVLAYYLGTSYQSDALNTVYSVDQVLYPLLGVGIWKVFLPLYKERVVNNELDEANSFANKTITLFTVASVIMATGIGLFSHQIVSIIAPGFDPNTKELAAKLVAISAPMYFFVINGAIYSSMLQCHNKFFGSQIREVVTHLPVVLCAIFLYKKWGITTLAIGVLIGGIMRMLIELPFVDWGYKWHIDFRFKSKEMKTLLYRYPSAMLSEGVNQINILIDKIMASMLTVGSVSALNYSNKLTSMINGLLSVALSTALYPQFVELKERGKEQELKKILINVINIFSFVVLPITFGCIFFSNEVVSVIYKRGVFDASSVGMTTSVFACYCVGLFFIACNAVLTNVFFAYGDTKSPLIISVINLIANVIFNIVFIHFWGAAGLALATSLSAAVSFFARLIWLKKIIIIHIMEIANCFIKSSILSVISCGLAKLLVNQLALNVYITMLLAVAVAVVVYVAGAFVLKMKELKFLLSIVHSRLRNNNSQ